MANTFSRKGVLQPQNGFVDGIMVGSTEATTFSVDVTTVGYTGVTSVIQADVVVNSGAAQSTSVSDPSVSWTTTNTTIKLTIDASLSTATVAVRFVGQ